MTSDVNSKQTNELLQRRRLRLQQVREQSKEIAKKIRQRAKVESLQQGKDVDEKKLKQYLDCQKQFVSRLQQLYTNGLENIGAAHKDASDHVQQETDEKNDKSKLRGIEAVAAVRRKKQEILNKKKELLDRKLQARDAANERSRERSNTVSKNLQPQVSDTVSNKKESEKLNCPISDTQKVDMATQLAIDDPLNDCETEIPKLLLPESENVKDGADDKPEDVEKTKRPNLFALSDEMPSSLRGGTISIPQETIQIKPSLTLVSEYIQNRRLRLRETEIDSNKKPTENLENVKQTILRTKASKMEGNIPTNVCKVLDDQFMPIPNWRAEFNSPMHFPATLNSVLPPINSRKFKSIFNSSNNKMNQMARSKPKPIPTAGDGACDRHFYLRNFTQSARESNKENSTKRSSAESVRKGLVEMYDHSTRNVITLPCNDKNLVTREQKIGDDAFTKARKQETNDNLKQKKLQDKIAEERSKVAMNKESVDKEYRDTLAFLNSLPKDMSSKPNRAVFMDEKRQQQLKDNNERKLENEFKSIEKECKKHRCKYKKHHLSHNPTSSSKEIEDLNKNKIQYSWVPVPEKESNLALHNIPMKPTHKELRHGNTVKFSDDNDYLEYRSNHKHTPPTKDIPKQSKNPKNRFVETVLIEQNRNDSTDCTSINSDSSSMENIVLNRREKDDESSEEYDSKRSETDRIIIYKILNSKNDRQKKCRKKAKLVDKSIKTVETQESVGNRCNGDVSNKNNQGADNINNDINKASFEQLKEGIYRTVKENGDNMASFQFSEKPPRPEGETLNKDHSFRHNCCHCAQQNTKGADVGPPHSVDAERSAQKCNCINKTNTPDVQTVHYPSAATSTSSLKTNIQGVNVVPPNGACIKLLEEGSQENGKFYVGTTGFLKNDAYEVVIQLRKKEISGGDVVSSKNQYEFAHNAKDTDTNLPQQKSEGSIQSDNIANKISACADKKSDDTCPGGPAIPVCPVEPNDDTVSSKIEVQAPQVTTSGQENKNNNELSDNISPRLCAAPKQAISTYTQTTSSPIHRPIFMHMSSSTSTAYMSPPEIIMPHFFKQNYTQSYDETCDSTTFNEPHYLQRGQCTCKRHDDNRRSTSHQTKTLNKCKKLHSTQNSASSTVEPSETKNCGTIESTTSKKRHTLCNKCTRNFKSNKNVNRRKSSITKVNKEHLSDDINSLRNKNLQNTKINNSKRINKASLNPVIKAYVNKLLELNKEGMKAVEIINQDCSLVPTPGSSIINNTMNVHTMISDEKKISLEQIKNILKQKIISDCMSNDNENYKKTSKLNVNDKPPQYVKPRPKLTKRKQVHKVKSLNISRKLSKTGTTSNYEKYDYGDNSHKPTSTSSSIKNSTSDRQDFSSCSKQTCSRKSTVLPQKGASVSKNKSNEFDLRRAQLVTTPFSTDSENIPKLFDKHKKREQSPPAHISTQTSGTFDSDNNFMKVAENKLQNMEKIADLTEKCTKRLSNLAKVLEEVRRNKSLVYSQITSSDTTSDSDLERNRSNTKNRSPLFDYPDFQNPLNKVSSLTITSEEEKEKTIGDAETFMPLLTDIPKPLEFKTPTPYFPIVPNKPVAPIKENSNNIIDNFKLRGKPPPALSRIHLKNEQEQIVPHELSTVLEVDSPMSLKLKSKSRIDLNADVSKKSTESIESTTEKVDRAESTILLPTSDKDCANPDLVECYPNKINKNTKTLSNGSSDDSKLRMMDLKEFNEIMLQPFISIQEYAKKKNIKTLDEASIVDGPVKEIVANEDRSSLHSDSSLPDVIAELLKRKIINEPFKFDTASNINSSTISSESTLSLIGLSNSRKNRNKSVLQNKKSVPEMSDTLSISSNPDLENAFQKLGMGWASSTLKKTKERLALSSSSNTSSSSGLQFRNKNNPSISEPISIITPADKTPRRKQNGNEISKNAEQQTSLPNSMTVKEFLTNELAKKITFTNQSARDNTDREFVSLFETKMPDVMKQMTCEEDQSADGLANCSNNNNRARTSTPVQIFRSMTYHSSSSTNTSNGLFSNADDISSVKVTSNSIRNHSTSDKDDLTIPNYMLRKSKAHSDCSKSDN